MSVVRRFAARVFILSSLALFLPNGGLSCLADNFEGKCVRILDGDTIEVMQDGFPVKVRLDGIDCPEKKQPFGKQAKDFTASLVFQHEVRVDWKKKDRYGRVLGSVKLSDGRAVNEELLRYGYAWWYRDYSKDGRLGKLEADARTQRIGLWSFDKSTPPWDFRKSEKK